jgi:hypothetical protein
MNSRINKFFKRKIAIIKRDEANISSKFLRFLIKSKKL